MSDHPEIIIVRRRGGHEEGHHGGAWKIAFADFMTAMMAFFLVLWIINATDKNTKTIIARYFNPVKVEDAARSTKGIHGQSQTDAASQNGETPTSEGAAPQKAETAKPADKAEPKPKSEENPKAEDKAKSADKAKPEDRSKSKADAPAPADPARPRPTMSEAALFSDPLASLERIAGAPAASPPSAEKAGGANTAAAPAAQAVEGYRDPFRPFGPSSSSNALDTQFGDMAPAAAEPPPSSPSPQASAPAQPPAEKPALPTPFESVAPKPGAAAKDLVADIQNRIEAVGRSAIGPAIEIKQTDEGILISLTDKLTFSMFALGSAEPQSEVVHVMDAIAQSLKTRPETIIVRGHTDARPYRSTTYDNWRLSSARAQMAYYMLARAGISEKRIERIEGYADRRLRDAAHPFAAENRRIEILLRETKP